MARDGKEKFKAKGGPFDGEVIWLSTDSTFEFTVTETIHIPLKRMANKVVTTGYYKANSGWSRDVRAAVWIESKPLVQPTYNFESRENINGFSNGL